MYSTQTLFFQISDFHVPLFSPSQNSVGTWHSYPWAFPHRPQVWGHGWVYSGQRCHLIRPSVGCSGSCWRCPPQQGGLGLGWWYIEKNIYISHIYIYFPREGDVSVDGWGWCFWSNPKGLIYEKKSQRKWWTKRWGMLGSWMTGGNWKILKSFQVLWSIWVSRSSCLQRSYAGSRNQKVTEISTNIFARIPLTHRGCIRFGCLFWH